MTKRIDRPRLAPLDRDSINTAEKAAVAAILDRFGDRLERLAAAAALADEAQTAADRARPKRDACALSLAAHEGVRALNRVLGITRTYFAEMRKAAGPNVRHLPAAARRLPALADEVARNEARAAAARAARDVIVLQLDAEGWSRPRIADLIGRNPSRISHIKQRNAQPATVAP